MSLTPQDMAELERSNALFVLLAIEKNPGITKKGITTMCDVNVRTRYQRIQELTELGLITYEDGPRYNSKLLTLTPEGKEVATKLKKIRYIILKLKKEQNINLLNEDPDSEKYEEEYDENQIDQSNEDD